MKSFNKAKKVLAAAVVLALMVTAMFSLPMSVQAATSLKVQMYNGDRAAATGGVKPLFKLVNTGTTVINLSDVKIRYYYTKDGSQAQSFWCDYSPAGSSNVTGNFIDMTPVTGADCYLEVGFTAAAGSLAVGSSLEVQTRFTKSDWSNYTQTGDYSFNSTSTAYGDWDKATAYIAGTLYWGTEPAGSATPTPTPTTTPTPTPTATVTPTPTPTPTGSPATNGLRGEYYDNMDLTDLHLVRTDATINFDWQDTAPDATMDDHTYSVRWTGQVQPLYTQSYTFYTTTSDGIRLLVNNQLIIDRWIGQPQTECSGTISLTANQKYDIKMEYFENDDKAIAKLEWKSSSQARQVIPQASLFCTVPTDTQAPTAPSSLSAPSKTDTTVSLSWGASSDNIGVSRYEVYRRSRTTIEYRTNGSLDSTQVIEKDYARVGTTASTSFTDQGLAPNSTETYTYEPNGPKTKSITISYTYMVKAYDAAGNVSSASNALNVSTNSFTPSGTGLVGKYYHNKDFTQLEGTRTDATVSFDWGTTPPYPTNNGAFSVRWTGQVQPKYTENCTFEVQPGPASGVEIVNDNFNRTDPTGWTTYGGTWSIENGTAYTVESGLGDKSIANNSTCSDFTYDIDVKIANDQEYSDAGVVFRATNPDIGTDSLRGYVACINAQNDTLLLGRMNNDYTSIQSVSMPVSANTYYHLRIEAIGSSIKVYVDDMNTPKISATDTTYTTGSIGVRTFGTKAWFDNVLVKEVNNTISTTDGVRLWVNNLLVVDKWVGAGGLLSDCTGTVMLMAGVKYDIRLEYANEGPAGVKLLWSSNHVTKEVIPSQYLYPSAADTQAPSAPSGLTLTAKSDRAVSMSWTASTDNTSVRGYEIYRNGTRVRTVSDTKFTDTSLTPNTSYTYTVKALDGAYNLSTDSNTLSVTTNAAAAAPTPAVIPVVVVRYFPDTDSNGIIDPGYSYSYEGSSIASLQSMTTTKTNTLEAALERGSKYHGYKNAGAPQYLDYQIKGTFDFLTPIPSSGGYTDYVAALGMTINDNGQNKTIQQYIEQYNIKEVWFWCYNRASDIGSESNMSGPYGNISNNRGNALPSFDHTVIVYDQVYDFSVAGAMEHHTHQLEAMFNYLDGIKSTTVQYNYDYSLFWGKLAGMDNKEQMHNAPIRCGWTHQPINARYDNYDYFEPNLTWMLSDAEDWNPDGLGTLKNINTDTWNNANTDLTCEETLRMRWKIYWMQNLPGYDNGILYNGKELTNWWDILANFDTIMQNQGRLVK